MDLVSPSWLAVLTTCPVLCVSTGAIGGHWGSAAGGDPTAQALNRGPGQPRCLPLDTTLAVSCEGLPQPEN